jgi:EVE domain-containing protein
LSGSPSSPSTFENRKWLLIATIDNWKKCLENKSWGVKERYKNTIQRMKVGDEFLVHLTQNKTAGLCKVTREYYYDTQPTCGKGTGKRTLYLCVSPTPELDRDGINYVNR